MESEQRSGAANELRALIKDSIVFFDTCVRVWPAFLGSFRLASSVGRRFATTECQVYLSAEGLETGFTTAKSSEMNVCFPDPKSADGELIERPIPEQFTHKVTQLATARGFWTG